MAQALAVHVISVALLVYSAIGATIVVTNNDGDGIWSTGAYSNTAAAVGDVLRFNYNKYHDVMRMADATAYASCSGNGAMELGTNSIGGGTGIYTNQYDYTVTTADIGAIYFSCSYSPRGTWNHCHMGQAVTVNVTAEPVPTQAPMSAPSTDTSSSFALHITALGFLSTCTASIVIASI